MIEMVEEPDKGEEVCVCVCSLSKPSTLNPNPWNLSQMIPLNPKP
jgi:hypothetical protein